MGFSFTLNSRLSDLGTKTDASSPLPLAVTASTTSSILTGILFGTFLATFENRNNGWVGREVAFFGLVWLQALKIYRSGKTFSTP